MLAFQNFRHCLITKLNLRCCIQQKYKDKTELILSDSKIENLGIAMTWLFPYWKQTKKEIQFEESLIDISTIEKEVKEIKNYAQQK